ncbi:MAG: chemotaxis protein CheC [Firmicutes bacterium]|nr:chemotaxis protein CheC [Bacillota bacterium]
MTEKESLKISLSILQIDALKEVGSIGTAHAATALSDLTGTKVNIKVPHVELCRITQIPELSDFHGKEITGIRTLLKGGMNGEISMIMESTKALNLAALLLKKEPGTIKMLGTMEISALKEAVNIMIGSYLMAVTRLSGILSMPSVPELFQEDFDSHINALIEKNNTHNRYAIIIHTIVILHKTNIDGNLILIPEAESLERILDSIGVK